MPQTDGTEPEGYQFAALNMVCGFLKAISVLLKVVSVLLTMAFVPLKMVENLLKIVLMILKTVRTTKTTFKDDLTLVSMMKKPVGVLKKLDLLQRPSSKPF